MPATVIARELVEKCRSESRGAISMLVSYKSVQATGCERMSQLSKVKWTTSTGDKRTPSSGRLSPSLLPDVKSKSWLSSEADDWHIPTKLHRLAFQQKGLTG